MYTALAQGTGGRVVSSLDLTATQYNYSILLLVYRIYTDNQILRGTLYEGQ